jgi:hypothetical protein
MATNTKKLMEATARSVHRLTEVAPCHRSRDVSPKSHHVLVFGRCPNRHPPPCSRLFSLRTHTTSSKPDPLPSLSVNQPSTLCSATCCQSEALSATSSGKVLTLTKLFFHAVPFIGWWLHKDMSQRVGLMNVAVVVARDILCCIGCLNKSLEKAPVLLPQRPNTGYNKHFPRVLHLLLHE